MGARKDYLEPWKGSRRLPLIAVLFRFLRGAIPLTGLGTRLNRNSVVCMDIHT